MKLLVAGCTSTLERYKEHPNIGRLIDYSEKPPKDDIYFAADNSCFSKSWSAERYSKLCEKLVGTKVAWITAPDVVLNHQKTLALFYEWKEFLNERRLPIAFVLQNGAEAGGFDLKQMGVKCAFIGGDDEFKESKFIFDICQRIKQDGVLIHMGRVNSLKRVQWAQRCGVDSIDGTGICRQPNMLIPRYLSWINKKLEGSLF